VQRPGPLLVGADPFFNSRRGLIVTLAARQEGVSPLIPHRGRGRPPERYIDISVYREGRAPTSQADQELTVQLLSTRCGGRDTVIEKDAYGGKSMLPSECRR
jgi:hypothetical protein